MYVYILISIHCSQVQGTFGWRTVTALFTKDEEEEGTDQRVEQSPEMATEQ